MYRLTLLALMACGGAASAPATKPAPEPATQQTVATGERSDVDIAAFAKKHAEGATVIDVRTDAEWNEGHVPGAIHIPLDQLKPGHAKLSGLEGPVHFICASGGRSARAADKMAASGMNAVNVLGGTHGWIAAGHEVEK